MLNDEQRKRLGLSEGANPCACQDCGARMDYEDGEAAQDLLQRHEAGDTFMDKECGECGALLAFLSYETLLEEQILATPVPDGLTRFRVVQQRDAFVNYYGFVDAVDADEALDKGKADALIGPLPDNWLDGDDATEYDSRHIGVESLDGEPLIAPSEA